MRLIYTLIKWFQQLLFCTFSSEFSARFLHLFLWIFSTFYAPFPVNFQHRFVPFSDHNLHLKILSLIIINSCIFSDFQCELIILGSLNLSKHWGQSGTQNMGTFLTLRCCKTTTWTRDTINKSITTRREKNANWFTWNRAPGRECGIMKTELDLARFFKTSSIIMASENSSLSAYFNWNFTPYIYGVQQNTNSK